MRAAIYTRQSLDRTGAGLAIARQLAENEKLCADRGWEIVARESDNDMSGYSGKPRPGYQRIITLMETGRVDVVVVWAVDRLTRRLADLADLIDLCERTGVKIATVSGDLDLSTDAGRLVARILGSVAQGEVERKSSRQKLAERQAAEAGRTRRGTPQPFGWQRDRLTAHPAEGPAVADACRALLAGGTITGVARDWSQRGLRPHQAPFGPLPETPWTPTSIRLILSNPRNAGIATYRGTEVARGEWEPLVSEETWRAVVRLLGEKKRGTKGVTTLLGGLAFCRCGNHAGGSSSAHGLPAYRCIQATRDGRPGPHVAVKAGEVDAAIGRLVVARLSEPDAAGLLQPAGGDGNAVELADEAQAIRSRLAALGGMFIAGQIAEQDMISGRAEGERRLAGITAALEDLGRGSVLGELIAAEDTQAEWDALGTDRKRAVVGALMVVTLYPSGRGARRFDPAVTLPPGRGIVWKHC